MQYLLSVIEPGLNMQGFYLSSHTLQIKALQMELKM
jgi:hypothetical protein